jgi:hypothetical protein
LPENHESSIHFLEPFNYGPKIIEKYIEDCKVVNVQLKSQYSVLKKEMQMMKARHVAEIEDIKDEFKGKV